MFVLQSETYVGKDGSSYQHILDLIIIKLQFLVALSSAVNQDRVCSVTMSQVVRLVIEVCLGTGVNFLVTLILNSEASLCLLLQISKVNLKTEMCKKSFVTMKSNQKSYKVYLSDVLRVHTAVKKSFPPAPAYDQVMSPKTSDKDTCIESESFQMM